MIPYAADQLTFDDRHRAKYRGYTIQRHGSGATTTFLIISSDGERLSYCASPEVATKTIDEWLSPK